MQNQLLPILIFAQSGRFIAQSATQAGYRVWVADCFGDQDTLAIAERWQQLESISNLSEADILSSLALISQGEDCLLVFGSGIEYHYAALNRLPANIKLIGNSPTTAKTLQVPSLFFNLLKKLNLAYPKTQLERPKNNKGWLTKSASGFGGVHIQYMSAFEHSDNYYFQQYVDGTSGSAVFLANGKSAQILGINQQYLQPCERFPFRLGGIISPWPLSEQQQLFLELAVTKITVEIQLLGINSLDFIISNQNQLLLLEINPRISASTELLNCTEPLFRHHISACQNIASVAPIDASISSSQLHYLYAKHEIQIPNDIVWPSACKDIPVGGSTIHINEPICTLHIQNIHPKMHQQCLTTVEKKILEQLKPYSSSSSPSKL